MKYLLLLSFMLLLFSCEVEEVDSLLTDELIVGLSYGECSGDCAFLYQLKGDLVYEDTGINHVATSPTELTFSATPLGGITQARIDSLFDELPTNLDSYETEDFGCPDCGDWGSLHVIQVTEAGVYKSYVLDNATENMNINLQFYGELLQRSLLDFRG